MRIATRWEALVLAGFFLLAFVTSAGGQTATPPPQITGPLTVTGKTGQPLAVMIASTPRANYYAHRGGNWPMGASLDLGAGTITGTPVQTGTFQLVLAAANTGPMGEVQWGPNATITITITDGAGPPAPVILGPFSTTGTVGRPFSLTFSATNNPRQWGMQTGNLPPGVRLDFFGGSLSGTPTQAGTFSFSILAENAGPDGSRQWSSPANVTITINNDSSPPPSSPPPAIDPAAPVISGPAEIMGQTRTPLSAALVASNQPTQFAIRSGTLQPGLSLNPGTGVIGGTPEASGTATISVAAANAGPSGLRWGAPASVRVTILTGAAPAVPEITGPGNVTGTVGQQLAVNFTTKNQPREFAIRSGTLPPGVHMDLMAGALSGVPTQAGSFRIEIAAGNQGTTGTQWGPLFVVTFTIAADPNAPSPGTPPPSTPPPAAPPAPGPVAPSPPPASTTPAISPTRISSVSANSTPIVQGVAPANAQVTVYIDGRVLGTATADGAGVWLLDLSGTLPIPKGRYTLHAVAVTSSGASTTSLTFTLEVLGTLPTVPTQSFNGQVGVAVTSAAITAQGDPAPRNFTADTLPAGITLNRDTGAFSGTPTAAGTTTMRVTCENNIGQGGATITFHVAAPAVSTPAPTTTPPVATPPSTPPAATTPVVIGTTPPVPPDSATPPPAGTVTPPVATTPPPAGGTPPPVTAVTPPAPATGTTPPPASLPPAVTPPTTSPTPVAPVVTTAPTPSVPPAGTTPPGTSVTPPVATTSGLANVSARMEVSESDAAHAFITGFVVSGEAPRRVLVRATGPALTGFGVNGALPNPLLEVTDANGRLLAANNGTKAADVVTVAQAVGAFPLHADAADAAVVLTLPPGAYSMAVKPNGGTGVALAEVFDASDSRTAGAGLANVSTRGFVGRGEAQLTTGFVISGDVPKRVLIRAAGPALATFNVNGTVADPGLVVQQGTRVVAQNDDWQTAQGSDIATAGAAVGAFAFAAGSKDSAIVVDLAPGAYTATVTGAGGGTGAALLEVYELTPR